MKNNFRHGKNVCVVETDKGSVQGYHYNGVDIFKGIPYAKARRFHAPKPADPWDGVLEADTYGPTCLLMDPPVVKKDLLCPHRFWVMDENCQNLNVWTPRCDDKKRPVMVWLHGGGCDFGSAIEQIAYEGENMSRIGDVVVVSINHRLNILGYFDLSEFGEEYANSGNAGGDDIIAALKWIHTNIKRFGGDPDNVTVFGQSGGGWKVTTLLQSPAADGLYHKGIIMSGILPIQFMCGNDPHALAREVMRELKIDTAKELEDVAYSEFVKAYKKVRPVLKARGKYVGCEPLKNEHYAGYQLLENFREETRHIPLMTGSTFGEHWLKRNVEYDKGNISEAEGEALVRKYIPDGADEIIKLFRSAYPDRNPADVLYLDVALRETVKEFANRRSRSSKETYAYMFNFDLPYNGESVPAHCADIPFVFHNTELVPSVQMKGETKKMEETIFDFVMSFARNGKPESKNAPEWLCWQEEKEYTMVVGKTTALRSNMDGELNALLLKKAADLVQDMSHG